jgi:hypothetical protein
MFGLIRTAADTWHVIEIPNNVVVITYANSIEEAVKQLDRKEQNETETTK